MAELTGQHPQDDSLYTADQKQLHTMFAHVRSILGTPILDPGNDYIINIGCGEFPDHCLRAFANQPAFEVSGLPIAIIGVDIDNHFRLPAARGRVKSGDNIDLRLGDASALVTEIANEKHPYKPKIIVSRNPTTSDEPGQFVDIPYQGWSFVTQAVYDALNYEGHFIVTIDSLGAKDRVMRFMRQSGFKEVRELPKPEYTGIRGIGLRFIMPFIWSNYRDSYIVSGRK